MNYCNNCGNKITNNKNYCEKCNQEITQNTYDDYSIIKNNKKKNIFAIISIILTLIPYLLYIYYYIEGYGALIFVAIYFYTFGAPISIVSQIFGIKSYIIKRNILAGISLILNSLPLTISCIVIIILILGFVL